VVQYPDHPFFYPYWERLGKLGLSNKQTSKETIWLLKMAVFWAIALMMEAARASETLVNFYQTTRFYNPEDSHPHTHRRENVKSYLIWLLSPTKGRF
jgi:hypothetical protein